MSYFYVVLRSLKIPYALLLLM